MGLRVSKEAKTQYLLYGKKLYCQSNIFQLQADMTCVEKLPYKGFITQQQVQKSIEQRSPWLCQISSLHSSQKSNSLLYLNENPNQLITSSHFCVIYDQFTFTGIFDFICCLCQLLVLFRTPRLKYTVQKEQPSNNYL